MEASSTYHRAILSKRFIINDRPRRWTSLEWAYRGRLPGFRTKRIAKVRQGRYLYFTIGETIKGREHNLSSTIERIIQKSGLTVIKEPSTAGNLTRKKLYVGFDLARCQPDTLERILKRVQDAIASCE